MFGLLNTHSHYSLLRGIARVPRLLERAKEAGYGAVALMDTNNMYGAVEFYKHARKAGVRPILGVTLFTQDRESRQLYPLILLAETREGYRNLLILITLAHFSEGKTPVITHEQLAKSSEGIIALLPALYSTVQENLIQNNRKGAERHLSEYVKVFGNNFFIGISPQNPTPKNGTPIEQPTEAMVALAREKGVGVVPLPLVYLPDEGDAEGREILLHIQRLTRSPREEDVFEDTLLMPQRDTIEEWTRSVCPEAVETLADIIQRCDWELELGNWVFPNPPVPEGSDHEQILREYIEEGYAMRDLEKGKETEERVETEMKTIVGRGYTSYFLTVIDLMRYMHKNGIFTTIRGSAAGSMVAYLTGITNVNPIEYQLPFERFLNPFRPSPPDIDIDIADNRRNEVIEYIVRRFGKEKVAQIGTLGTMMARAAVRDTARALGYSYTSGDQIARLIPLGVQGAPVYIDDALEQVKELKTLYDSNDTARHIINAAKKIEGNARHMSVHAGGVVISPTTIIDYTPLERDPKGVTDRPITQYDMHAVEDAGLLKFDVLGLTNLAILAETVEMVKQDRGEEIDVERIPLNDRKAYTMIGKGYTAGVFQLGGSGMTAALTKMQPTNIYDIAAIIALYRPGPMRNIDEYIARKQGEKPVTYLHESMKKYLRKSYGVLVYQDDLLYTAIELAGYDWKEVDVFRKAVGKKIPELMAEQEKIFKKRVKEHSGASDLVANKLWDLFDPFKGYGFNKAHAISYAKVAYQTAYMKANFPAQSMTALLSAAGGDTETVTMLMHESKRLGLTILPPHINHSDSLFTTEKGENRHEDVRIGLATIKKVGQQAADAITGERKKNGKYASLEDFLMRMAPYKVLRRQNLMALIKTGVLDSFGERGMLLENLPLLIASTKEMVSDADQQSLFSTQPTLSLSLKQADEKVHILQRLFWERELIGVYISGHPIRSFREEGLSLKEVHGSENGRRVMVVVVVDVIIPHRNKSGDRMCFLRLSDDKNEKMDAVCFAAQTAQYEELLAPHRVIKIKGTVATRNNEVSIKVEEIENPAMKE